MISIARLREDLDGDWVAFDKHGHLLHTAIPGDIGPAALLVSSVTDALKIVDIDGKVETSVDRDQMWVVDAIVLNRVIFDHLVDQDLTAEDLLEAVREAGFTWQISPISAP